MVFRKVRIAMTPAILIAGDSIAATYPAEHVPMTGWGQVLGELTRPEIRVVNFASPGRSTKSFRTQGRWDALLEALRKDDFVLIQFGHNDQKSDIPYDYADENAYCANLKRFISEVRAKGALPVLLTSVARRKFDEHGVPLQTLGVYPELMRGTAEETEVPLIDLNAMTTEWLERIGAAAAAEYFMHVPPGVYPDWKDGAADDTHFREKGARLIAGMIAEDAKRRQLPLAECFR